MSGREVPECQATLQYIHLSRLALPSLTGFTPTVPRGRHLHLWIVHDSFTTVLLLSYFLSLPRPHLVPALPTFPPPLLFDVPWGGWSGSRAPGGGGESRPLPGRRSGLSPLGRTDVGSGGTGVLGQPGAARRVLSGPARPGQGRWGRTSGRVEVEGPERRR